jgi:flotillin
MSTIINLLPYVFPAIFVIGIVLKILTLRRIVPTNVVHIVQRGKQTVSYGVGKTSNVYYEWPKWIPKLGVEVRELPVSNFDIELYEYSAYDKDRVPFIVDVKAFFHIADTNTAAAKVASFDELKQQLNDVVQGAVRSILAKSNLESIMEERSVFGEQFTKMVNADLKNWGVESIKNIELMDVRDSKESEVIHQIMAKRMSAIDMESRSEVASNNRKAVEAELDAEQKIKVKQAHTTKVAGEAKAESDKAIGVAQAESIRVSGMAEQASLKDIAEAKTETEEKNMEVIKVTQVRQASINKEQEIIDAEKIKRTTEIGAEADRYKVETAAAAKLEARVKDASGVEAYGKAEASIILAKGNSVAESLKLEQLASVTAQTTLASEIGENIKYQDYLIRVKTVDKDQVVDVAKAEAMAKALESADLKILANSGDVNTGLNSFTDILSSKGGSQMNGMIEALKQTPEGQGIMKLLSNLNPDSDTASDTTTKA